MAEPSSFETIAGGCHCGAVRFELRWTQPRAPIPTRACGCGLCRKHRAVWTSDPKGAFRLIIPDPHLAHRYRFGTKTADFHICRACGVLPIATCQMESSRFAVLNIHTFEGVDPARFTERATNFDGETSEARLARRRQSWTPEANSEQGG